MPYFDDLQIGERRDYGSHTFTAEEIKAFARLYDPQPFHLDEAAAARSPFGALCASGWHTVALWMRHMVLYRQNEDAARRARGLPVGVSGPSPGIRELRWLKPVYVGDTIRYAGEVRELRHVARHGWGLAVNFNSGTNQNGELVMSFVGSEFLPRRNNGAAS
jgi:acyl dehydratase